MWSRGRRTCSGSWTRRSSRVLLEEAVVFEFLELFGLALVDPFLGLGLLASVDLGAKGSDLKGSGFGGRFGQGSAAAAWSGQRGARRGKGGERWGEREEGRER
jgi:hypothetical protein